MINRVTAFLIIITISLVTCKKSESTNVPPPDNKVKLVIFSGNNQSDTIGHPLKDSIVLRVTKNGQPLNRVQIRSDKTGCMFTNSFHVVTDGNGFARYKWELNGKAGDQTVRFTALDSLLNPLDSVIAHAEGKYYNNAWQISDCLPNAGINDVCQSGSGRLFCGIRSLDLPYYSDNNGVSWQKLTTFPLANKEIKQMVAKGNEVYIATRLDGIYYSPDNGTTWQNRSSGITNVREVAKLGITKSGKLFLSTFLHPLFLSADKGVNWLPITSGVDFNDQITSYCETSMGMLYMVSDDEDLYKSTTGGTSWIKVRPTVSNNVQSIFVDDNDDLYFGSFGSTARIYKSVDGGITWQHKYSSPVVPGIYLDFKDFYKVNGVYYFMIAGYGIVKTPDFSTFSLLTNRYFLEYLAGNNGAVYVPGMFENLWYNMNP